MIEHRLLRRVRGPLGAAHVQRAESRYDRAAGWATRHLSLVDRLLQRASVADEQDADEPFVFVASPIDAAASADAGAAQPLVETSRPLESRIQRSTSAPASRSTSAPVQAVAPPPRSTLESHSNGDVRTKHSEATRPQPATQAAHELTAPAGSERADTAAYAATAVQTPPARGSATAVAMPLTRALLRPSSIARSSGDVPMSTETTSADRTVDAQQAAAASAAVPVVRPVSRPLATAETTTATQTATAAPTATPAATTAPAQNVAAVPVVRTVAHTPVAGDMPAPGAGIMRSSLDMPSRVLQRAPASRASSTTLPSAWSAQRSRSDSRPPSASQPPSESPSTATSYSPSRTAHLAMPLPLVTVPPAVSNAAQERTPIVWRREQTPALPGIQRQLAHAATPYQPVVTIQRQDAAGPPSSAAQPAAAEAASAAPDSDDVADHVARTLRRQLVIERERRGGGR